MGSSTSALHYTGSSTSTRMLTVVTPSSNPSLAAVTPISANQLPGALSTAVLQTNRGPNLPSNNLGNVTPGSISGNLPGTLQHITPLGNFSIIPIQALQVRGMMPGTSLQQITFPSSQIAPIAAQSVTSAVDNQHSANQQLRTVVSASQASGSVVSTSQQSDTDVVYLTDAEVCQQAIRQSQLEQAKSSTLKPLQPVRVYRSRGSRGRSVVASQLESGSLSRGLSRETGESLSSELVGSSDGSWIKKEPTNADSDEEEEGEERFIPFKREMLDEDDSDHDPSEGYFKCHDCDKVFQEICYLKTHITKVHRTDAMHICPHCSKVSYIC